MKEKGEEEGGVDATMRIIWSLCGGVDLVVLGGVGEA